MCVTERDLGGKSGGGDLRRQQIPALAPGKEKLLAEAATVFKVGGDVKRTTKGNCFRVSAEAVLGF